MGNDAKRTILTKLFDEIVYVGGSVSVKLSFLAESIAKRSDETRQIMETQKVLNQTAKNDEINSGQENKIDLKNEIYPVWHSYTTKLEPIFSKKCNPEPRRLSAVWRTRPDQKTLCIFFEIFPAVIFWKRKRVFWSGAPTASSRGGAALVGIADALRALP